jgi:hypothetical protein
MRTYVFLCGEFPCHSQKSMVKYWQMHQNCYIMHTFTNLFKQVLDITLPISCSFFKFKMSFVIHVFWQINCLYKTTEVESCKIFICIDLLVKCINCCLYLKYIPLQLLLLSSPPLSATVEEVVVCYSLPLSRM